MRRIILVILAMLLFASCIAPAEFSFKGAADGGKDAVDGRMADGRTTLDLPEVHGKDLPRSELPDAAVPDVDVVDLRDSLDAQLADAVDIITSDMLDVGPTEVTDVANGGDAGILDLVDATNPDSVDSSEVEACIPDCEELECGNDGCGGSCWMFDSDECDDGSPCTVDNCGESGSCVHLALPENVLMPLLLGYDCPCAKPADCALLEDDNLCNETLTCAFSPVDGEELVCMPDDGTGTSYDDDQFCNGLELCESESGEMIAGTPPETDDNIDCTVDLCDEVANKVTHTGDDNQCDDGNSCTGGTCDPAMGCVQATVEGFCSDADSCTHTDSCVEDLCVGTTYDCDDDLECTDNICDGEGGCDHPLLEEWCLIDDECVAAETPSPESPCLACLPEESTDAYAADDTQNCGPLPEALSTACLAGLCTVFECNPGRGHCDDSHANGCETDTTADLLHCGGCSKPCDQGQVCSLGECKNECDGELTKCDPAGCVDTQTNPLFCGNCETACDFDNATALCVDGQCTMGDCLDMTGDANGNPDDGCECLITNQGQELCNEWDDDCNGLIDDVADDLITTDPINCGQCGNVCPSGGVAQMAVCANKTCNLTDCADNQWDLNGNAVDGCEYECPYAGQQETCNELDDNCDGQVDEGFVLTSDLENCGACGNICAHASVAEYLCAGGQCIVLACNEGYKDANNQGTDGCEVEWQPDGELWVDSWEGGTYADDFDGSQDFPFSTIQEAIEYSFDGYLIHINEGIYTGGVEIDIPNLTIQGAGQDLVFVSTPEYGTGFHITADGVTVANLAISAGRYGIHFEGTEESPLQGGVAKNLGISSLQGAVGEGGDAAGVKLEWTVGVSVSQCEFSSVAGSEGAAGTDGNTAGEEGGRGLGVHVLNSTQCAIMANSFAGLLGGKGGAPSGSNRGGAGGVAAGLLLENATGGLISDNEVELATGGAGGGGATQSWGGEGGVGAGVYLLHSTGNGFSSNTFEFIYGGPGGPCWNAEEWIGVAEGADQGGFGFFFDEESLANTVETSNLVSGQAVVYLSGADGAVVTGHELMANADTTNLGKIVVVDSVNVTVKDNQIGFVGAPSGVTTAGSTATGGDGEMAAGIRLRNCIGCQVLENEVSAVFGGTGGTSGKQGFGGAGGIAAAVALEGCAGSLVSDNHLSDLLGGQGGGGMSGGGTSGVGTGVYLAGSSGNTVSGNSVEDVDGGPGGPAPSLETMGAQQEGYGVFLEETALDNTVEDTNLVEGDQTVYRYGEVDSTVQGYVLIAGSNPTNLGKIAVVDCTGVRVSNNEVAYFTGRAGVGMADNAAACVGAIGAGIRVSNCAQCTVSYNTVSHIDGGIGATGCGGKISGTGGIGVGLLLAGSTSAQVTGNQIEEVAGGIGGSAHQTSSGGPGGVGAGIYLSDSVTATVTSNLIGFVIGGDGGATASYYSSGVGGVGAGVYLEASEGAELAGNTLSAIAGGAGGFAKDEKATAGLAQVGYGLYMDPDSQGTQVALDNLLEGALIVYLHGVNDLLVEGVHVESEANPTNFGQIVLLDSDGVTVKDCSVSSGRGTAGCTGADNTKGCAGGDLVGLLLDSCTNCNLEGVVIQGLQGGQGGSGGYSGSGGNGGPVFGIDVVDSSGLSVSKLQVSGILGAPGGTGGYDENGGNGGATFGARFTGCKGLSLEEMKVNDIGGGVGGSYAYSGDVGGKGGEATGILVDSCTSSAADRVTVRKVSGGAGAPDKYAMPTQSGAATGSEFVDSAGFTWQHSIVADVSSGLGSSLSARGLAGMRVDNCPLMKIRNSVVHGIGFDTNWDLIAGVVTTASQNAPLSLLDSIVGEVTGTCLRNDNVNYPLALKADYSDIFYCNAATDNAQMAATCLSLPPMFVDPQNGDFHLSPGSPCIDAGKELSDYASEPEPNGCRVNIGAYGNTPEAIANPFVGHCPNGGLCQPNCLGKACGNDGCGGSCATCGGESEVCSAAHQCCVPDCEGKLCGDDGCGGSCGGCPDGEVCDLQFTCCQPLCEGKCGKPDGCGGICDTCAWGNVCLPSGLCAGPVECQGPIVCGQMKDMPGPRHMGTAVAFDGALHYLGGYVADGEQVGNHSDAVFTYAPAADLWSDGALAVLPAPLAYHGSAVVGGVLYNVGGSNGELLQALHSYGGQESGWQSLLDMPLPAQGLNHGTLEFDDKLFVLGGTYGGGYQYHDYGNVYDPGADGWSKTGNMVLGRRFIAAVVHGGSLYAFGGVKGWGTVYRHVERYDVGTSTWTQLGDLPVPAAKAITVSIGDYIYLMLAETGYNTPATSEVYRYDPKTDSWELHGYLAPAMTYSHRAFAQVGNSVYLFGGKRWNYGNSTTARVDVVVFE